MLYAPQTKILEDRTNDRACDFKVLYAGVSTRFGLRIIENCIEMHARSCDCSSKTFVWGAYACEQSDACFVAQLQGWVYNTQQRGALMIVGAFFVTRLQGWVYKTQHACEQSDAFLVTILQGWVYKAEQTCVMHAINQTLSL